MAFAVRFDSVQGMLVPDIKRFGFPTLVAATAGGI